MIRFVANRCATVLMSVSASGAASAAGRLGSFVVMTAAPVVISMSSAGPSASVMRSARSPTVHDHGSKHEAMSVSTTHRRPSQHSSMSTCEASCGVRLGRNAECPGRGQRSGREPRHFPLATLTDSGAPPSA